MHKESLEFMDMYLKKYLDTPCKVLDVGSMNIKDKGTYKQLLTDDWDYTGIDLALGPNVDVVLEDPFVYPFEDNTFDVVLCGQVMEHCVNPFKLMKECARVLKPRGLFFGVAPYNAMPHRYPVDCWRMLPDGWIALFDHARLTTVVAELKRFDCWGIARK